MKHFSMSVSVAMRKQKSTQQKIEEQWQKIECSEMFSLTYDHHLKWIKREKNLDICHRGGIVHKTAIMKTENGAKQNTRKQEYK